MNDTRDPSPISDVSTATFDQLVVERSQRLPVLVDFWAPWCGPCRSLTPVLERVVADLAGRVALAKVNSDENPELAARFQVQGIPTVVLIKEGKTVDRFVGALPERQIRAFLRPHCPSEADLLVGSGVEKLEARDLDGAIFDFERAHEIDDGCHSALLGLARAAFARGDLEAVEHQVAKIPLAADEHDRGQGLLEASQLIREAIGREDSSDIGSTFALGGHALADGDYRRALDHFLGVVRSDSEWNRQAGRRAMLTAFKIIGIRDPLSDEYRDKLRGILY